MILLVTDSFLSIGVYLFMRGGILLYYATPWLCLAM